MKVLCRLSGVLFKNYGDKKRSFLQKMMFPVMVLLLTTEFPGVRTVSISLSSSSVAASNIPLKHYKKIAELEKISFTITVLMNHDTLVISNQQQKVYEYSERANNSSGCIHVLVFNEATGLLMLSRRFRTYQPADQLNLRACLSAVQPGRVLVVVGLMDFLTFLAPDGGKSLTALGASMLHRVALGEPWAMVTIVGEELINTESKANLRGSYKAPEKSRVVAEVVATRVNGFSEKRLWLETTLFSVQGASGCRTSFPQPSKLQIHFCDKYEGYGELCRCHRPYVPREQIPPPSIPMAEDIPIVIVTANKPFYLYRILKNLKSVWGSAETKVLVVADGGDEETLQITSLFDLETILHSPQGEPGENTRTNMNIAFALYSVFNRWPQVDKVILLEDDLILAPDLLSFFHQTAPALTNDPTLYLVNAFGQNSYPSTASDSSTVMRADMYPQYGWMTCRPWVEFALPLWVHPGKGQDWDWWLYLEGNRRNQQAIVPEVSRTGHGGSAGIHVTGWEQQMYFNSRIMTHDPTTVVRHVERLESTTYAEWFENEIRNAKKIRLVDHPCHNFILPAKEKGPFVLYLGVASRSDGYDSFYFMQTCLGTDDQEVKELYEGVMRLRIRPYSRRHPDFRLVTEYVVNQTLLEDPRSVSYLPRRGRRPTDAKVLYLVGCPLSKYCKYSGGTSDWVIPDEALLYEAEKVVSRRKLSSTTRISRLRVPAATAEEEYSMKNLRHTQRHHGD
ncbi:protein O-linked-mannose beta-1,2-N-acetylglucosaminyltransferase 1-like [Palaemon carinicauda]|uniref:protein O-linked-mannose beta-1,2-N-acetylglucosaminyltransferase 1-like n=1 Tax=Palaemon carinicauda TaxID=392227 RepID=UPI0035B616F0